MSNVIALPTTKNVSSPCDYGVISTPALMDLGSGSTSAGHSKVLVREDTKQPLSIVHEKYNWINNRDLFDSIETTMSNSIDYDPSKMDIKDEVSYNGKIALRSYTFNDIRMPKFSDSGDVALKIIAKNSFGDNRAVSIYFGAIDFFCTNGMILGEYNHETIRHSSKLNTENVGKFIMNSVDVFAEYSELFEKWAKSGISHASVSGWLEANFNNLQAKRIEEQYLIEVSNRGNNVWSLYSALTHIATHSGLRETGQDHEADTRIKKHSKIGKLIHSDKWEDVLKMVA